MIIMRRGFGNTYPRAEKIGYPYIREENLKPLSMYGAENLKPLLWSGESEIFILERRIEFLIMERSI